MSAVVVGCLPFGFEALLLVPLPGWEAWPYITGQCFVAYGLSVVSAELTPDW